MAAPALKVKPVTQSTWPDFEALFESRGGPKNCWCMVWRDMPNRAGASAADRKAALHGRVADGTPIGLVAYLNGEPVGWVSAGPRETFRKLSPEQDDAEEGVWSVTCFFLKREHRGDGLAAKLLEEAAAYAFRRGAKVVEGYPVGPKSPSYRFMGFMDMFAGQGFRETGRAGSRRHIVRRMGK